MNAKSATNAVMTVTAPNFQVFEAKCKGVTPYVQHRFWKKGPLMKKQSEGSAGKSRKQKEPRDFDAEWVQAAHISTEGWYGIPAPSLRSAMISACRAAGIVMTRAKLSVFVEPDGIDDEGYPLVMIEGKPEKFMAYARNETGVVDIRARPMWKEWAFVARIRFDADMIGLNDVGNLLKRAGLQVGIGEGRPDSKKSTGQGWGLFDVVGSA